VIIQNASTCFFIAGLSLQHSRALDEFGEGSKNKKKDINKCVTGIGEVRMKSHTIAKFLV